MLEKEKENLKEYLKNIDAILFDMDGTLIDSLYIWAKIDVDFLGKYGYEVPDDYEGALMGMSFIQVAEYTKNRFDIPLSIDEIMLEWNRMAEYEYEYKVELKPYAGEFIRKYHEKGIKLGVCTSNSRILVEKCLARLGICDYMSVILTGDEITNGKPAPDIYLKAAETLQVSPDRCLVFEDVIPGIEAGHNAGMKVCAVKDQATLYLDDRKRQLAEFYISDYEELVL